MKLNTMKNFGGKVLFLISILINLLLILQIFGVASDELLEIFFRSDCLYLPSIYRDLFVNHHGLQGWNLNPAPNFLPEWPVYFLFNFISGDFRLASFIYALFNFFTISIFIALIYKKAFGEISWTFLSISNFAFGCFLMLFLNGFDFISTALIFLTAFHNGVFIMTLWATYILFIYIDKGKNLVLPLLLLIIALLGTLSDRLFLAFFLVPVFCTLAFIRFQSHRKKLLIISGFSLVGALLGLLFFNLLCEGSFISIHSASGRMFNFGNILNSFVVFYEHVQNFYFRAGFHRLLLFASILSVIVGLYFSFKFVFTRTPNDEFNRQKMAVVFFTAMILAIGLNPIINGIYIDFTILRYNIQAIYMAASILSVLFFYLSKRSALLKYLFIAGIIVINIAFILFIVDYEKRNATLSHISNVFHFYPESVARVDSIASTGQLKAGVADYSYAKVISMFSKENINVLHVYPNLAIYSHDTKNKWYIDVPDVDGAPSPVFNFIVLNYFKDDGSIKQLFHDRMDTLVSGDIKILKVPDFYFSPVTRRPVIIGQQE